MNQKQIAKCLDIEYKMYQDYPEGLNAEDGLVEFAKRITKPFNGLSDIDLVLLGDYFRTGQQVLRNRGLIERRGSKKGDGYKLVQ
jgi:hypothetical protein